MPTARYRRVVGAFARLSISSALALVGAPGGTATAGYGPIGAAFRVNTTIPGPQTASAVAIDAKGNYVVAWEGNNLGIAFANDIYAQRYSSRGVPLGTEFQVNTFTTGSQENAAVAMDADGDFVVAWESFNLVVANNLGVYAQRYTSAGAKVGGEFRANTYTTTSPQMPAIAIDADGDFTIVWANLGQDGSGYGIYAQRYAANGDPSGGEFRVNSYTIDEQFKPAIAMDAAGETIVTWESLLQDGHLDGVYAQRYDHTGAPSGAEFNLAYYSTGGHADPAVAMDAAGDFVAAWEVYNQPGPDDDIYARQYAASAVRIAQPAGGARVVEGGATASYHIALSTIPTTTVTLMLTPAKTRRSIWAMGLETRTA